MAFGDPMAMAGPPPMEDPMMGAPMGADPMMGPEAGMGMAAPAPDPDQMMMMLLEAVMGKWGESEMMVDMEKQMLVETLMQLVMPQPPVGPEAMVEGAGPVMPGTQMGDFGMDY